MFILLVIAFYAAGQAPTGFSAEFDSKETCELAKAKLEAKDQKSMTFYVICTKK